MMAQTPDNQEPRDAQVPHTRLGLNPGEHKVRKPYQPPQIQQFDKLDYFTAYNPT